MRWLWLAILGYACLALETAAFRPGGLAFPVDGHWTRPDLVLILGLLLALYLEPRDTFLAAWCLGMGSDLVSIAGRLGLYAIILTALLVTIGAARHRVGRTSALAQVGLCFAATVAAHLVWYVAARALEGAPPAFLRSVEESVLDAAYTAVLAPYVFWLVLRLRGPLGLGSERFQD